MKGICCYCLYKHHTSKMDRKKEKEYIVTIKNLKKSYEDHLLFDQYNLSIETGEFISITGPSGCGKTTLLNMVGGLEPYDAGQIIVKGKDIGEKSNKLEYFSDVVGFLFQNFVLMEDKTVEENLNIIKAHNRSEMSIESALGIMGLQNKLKSKVYTLSGGEQQRVALARLLIKKCDLILADEPTGSLDKKNADLVMSILKEINQTGKTILLVSHDSEIIKYGDRVLKLKTVGELL